MTTNTKTSETFEARIWEKAEHWYFDVKVKAESREAAYKELSKQYGKGYRIVEVR